MYPPPTRSPNIIEVFAILTSPFTSSLPLSSCSIEWNILSTDQCMPGLQRYTRVSSPSIINILTLQYSQSYLHRSHSPELSFTFHPSFFHFVFSYFYFFIIIFYSTLFCCNWCGLYTRCGFVFVPDLIQPLVLCLFWFGGCGWVVVGVRTTVSSWRHSVFNNGVGLCLHHSGCDEEGKGRHFAWFASSVDVVCP
jgi:hypothetical protein